MLNREDRLFYVHLNDNDKEWGRDMIPGSYNFWDFIELFYYIDEIGYDDWFAYDVFPKEIDTIETFNVVTENTLKLMEISQRIDKKKVKELLKDRNPTESMKYLFTLID